MCICVCAHKIIMYKGLQGVGGEGEAAPGAPTDDRRVTGGSLKQIFFLEML